MWTRSDLYAAAGLAALSLAIVALWTTPIVYPLRLLVVLFHELSHGAAAVLTGGEIVRIELVAAEGGRCITRGGSRFLTLSAGYLGSLAIGGAILVIAARSRLDRALTLALGALLAGAALLYVRPIPSFGFAFALAAGAALSACGLRLPERLCDGVLRCIGLTSCLYAVLDIKSDILDRPELRSDAVMLAEATGIPALVWGLLWITIALATSLLLVRYAIRPSGARRGVAADRDAAGVRARME